MKKPRHLLIKGDDFILNALKQLEETKERTLICVDEEDRLIGVIADGDIRRALIAGHTITSPVEVCVQKNPVYISSQASYEQAMKLLSDRVRLLPITDESHKVIDCYTYREKSLTEDIKLRNIAVFGLGYVGLTLALALADNGFNVLGYDISEELIGQLQKKKAPFFESGLQSVLEAVVGRNLHLDATSDNIKADIYIMTVGTPVNKDTGRPEVDSVVQSSLSIGKLLKRNDTVILRSTIPVGCSRNIVLPELEATSGLTCGEQFCFAFAPERTTEGKALLELRSNPQIVGGYDTKSAEIVGQLFNTITPSVLNAGSLEAAELCKLIDNCYRDHMFSFVNQLVPLTEHLGLDLCKVVDAANFGYPRNNVPKPSPGVGGPCLTKDPYILASVLEQYGIDCSLLHASRKANEFGPHHVYDKINNLLAIAGKDINKSVISLVGMAFKGNPETSDLRDSMSLLLLDRLRGTSASIRAYDPVVSREDLVKLPLTPVTLEDAFDGADAVVIMNNHQSYINWNLPALVSKMNHPAVFIDTWHIFDPMDIKVLKGIIYGGLGND